MAPARRVSSGTRWERDIGYCRAIEVGGTIYVAGTVAVDGKGATVAPNDLRGQLRCCFDRIAAALAQLDCSLADVVKTTLFVTDIGDLGAVAAVHGPLFAAHPPVTTCVQVAALVRPDLVVEVEAIAVRGAAGRSTGGGDSHGGPTSPSAQP